MIPQHIMHACISKQSTSDTWIEGERVTQDVKYEHFQAAILPMGNEDLRYAPEGTYTQNQQKCYTNGFSMDVGQIFTDTYDGKTYTVTTELTHSPIHPMKRYIVVQKGGADVRIN